MPDPAPLQPDRFYHLFNRGNAGEDLFREPRNYPYFLELYQHHIHPIASTFAYCLMRNHFHLLIKIRGENEIAQHLTGFRNLSGVNQSRVVSQQFSNLFNAYTKSINKAYERTGNLFERPFERIEVNSDNYFTNLIFYIHFNPQKHGFVNDFRSWKWSSYNGLLANGPSRLQRDELLQWFCGRERFMDFHNGAVDEKLIFRLVQADRD